MLIIPFSRDPEEAIRLQAQVAYRRGLRLGLHWGQIDAESSMKLQRLVEMNLGTLRLLERPLLSLIWPPANQPAGRGRLADRSADNRKGVKNFRKEPQGPGFFAQPLRRCGALWEAGLAEPCSQARSVRRDRISLLTATSSVCGAAPNIAGAGTGGGALTIPAST